MAVDLSSYLTVAQRIAEFRAKYPEGSLQPVDLNEPFKIVTIGDKTFIAYTAAAYRNQGDRTPGVGIAWEPFPGRTPYTRDSELMNAETSAWGRAIVAVLASDTTKGIATQEEILNRREASGSVPAAEKPVHTPAKAAKIAQSADLATLVDSAKTAETLDSLRETYLAVGNAGLLMAEIANPEDGEKITFKEYLEMRSDALGSPKSKK